MHQSDIPGKLPIPFASSAAGGYIRAIPTSSLIGVTDGAASLTDGFVPLNATPIGAGGVPPDIKDMNGILFEVSGWSRWQAAGGPVSFDAGFAAAIGGYPQGAFLQSPASPGVFYVSTADSNATDPEGVGAANWITVVPVPATNAEVAAGALATKFVTPASLAFLRASSAEILAGTSPSKLLSPSSFFAARASSADVLTGTDDHRYLTALAAAAANTTPGVLRFPGGAMLQYGSASASGGEGARTVTLPTPFPNAFFCAVVTPINTSGSTSSPNDMWAQWTPAPGDLAQLHWVAQSTGGNSTQGVSFIAIGN